MHMLKLLLYNIDLKVVFIIIIIIIIIIYIFFFFFGISWCAEREVQI